VHLNNFCRSKPNTERNPHPFLIQSLFRHEETGLEPFIGVIVSPYDHAAETTKSKFQYLSISPGWDASGSFRKYSMDNLFWSLTKKPNCQCNATGMPYSCVTEIQQCDQPASDIYPQLQALVDEYCEYEQ
jgi:protein MYSM1